MGSILRWASLYGRVLLLRNSDLKFRAVNANSCETHRTRYGGQPRSAWKAFGSSKIYLLKTTDSCKAQNTFILQLSCKNLIRFRINMKGKLKQIKLNNYWLLVHIAFSRHFEGTHKWWKIFFSLPLLPLVSIGITHNNLSLLILNFCDIRNMKSCKYMAPTAAGGVSVNCRKQFSFVKCKNV